jgi:hypothetical protein
MKPMSELAEYELPDGTTMQLSEEDAKRFPEAKKVGRVQQQATPSESKQQHEQVQNRARRN